MRILLYNCEQNVLSLDDKITVLEVENPKVFNGIMADLFVGSFPYNEVAIENENGLLTPKEIICITDIYNFNLSDKSILSKLYKFLDKYIAENPMLRIEYDEAFSKFSNAVSLLFNDIDIDFDYSQTNDVKNALSLIELSINVVDNSILDKLLQLLKLLRELKLFKIIVLVNVKSFLKEDELLELYKYSLYYQIPLILLESRHVEKLLENEQKVFVDGDFCDILIM